MRHLAVPILLLLAASACDASPAAGVVQAAERRVGVVLVSHGSRSQQWRQALLEVGDAVRDRTLALPSVLACTSAFMEYSEPSIATRLRELDELGVTEAVLVPLFLTVSAHTFDDIPTIYGGRRDVGTETTLRSEGIDLYRPRASVTMTPLLDYAGMLETNVVRRVRALSSTPATEGVVLVAYGDATYLREWNELLTRLGDRLRRDLGIDQTTHAWCGHLVHYEQGPTQQAIRDLLAVKQRALVVPVLVAVDEMFQHRIIGGAIDSMPERERVVYKPDAILPEPAIEAWVVDAVRAAVATDAKVAAGDR